MRARITKTFRFEAAHHLPNHDGKCREPHGHSYRVEVCCEGPITLDGPKQGMVIDFADIKDVWKNHLEPLLDHKDLNVSLERYALPATTAECLAFWITRVFRARNLSVTSVTVWETETSCATVTYDEVWANGE